MPYLTHICSAKINGIPTGNYKPRHSADKAFSYLKLHFPARMHVCILRVASPCCMTPVIQTKEPGTVQAELLTALHLPADEEKELVLYLPRLL